MKTRKLGSSGLDVTPLGIGLAALGRPGYINLGHAQDLERNYDIPAMEAHAHDVLDSAWDLGIRYFDAARSYGRAENFLSSWLNSRQVDPESVTVGSKWGYTYTAGWQVTAEHHEIKEHSVSVLQRQIGESRHLLGDQLDLYQIHSATLESGVLDNEGVLIELAKLRDGGLAIGLSVSGPAQSATIQRAMSIEYDGRPLFASVQATWNLLSQEAGDTLDEAHRAGMGIIIKEAVANGRLTSRNQNPEFAAKRVVLERAAESLGSTIDAVAIAAVLAQSWVDVVLSGAANVEQLKSNVDALNCDLDSWLGQLMDSLREDAETYWKTRSALSWN